MLKDNLKALRESKGLTKRQVAQGVGINERAYIAYEYGERDVSTDTLCKLAKFYSVTTDYLLGLEPPLPPADAMEVLGIEKSVDDDEFMKLYNELPDYAKQIFIDVMAKLSKATEQAKPQQKQRHVERLGDIEDAHKQEEATQQVTLQPNIQISKKALARSKDNPYRDAPTPEQIASFTPVPEDIDL